VRVDAIAVRLRPRTPMEAADLGTRLCQSAARDVYLCLFLAAIPIALLTAASAELARWLPSLVIWMAKPWLDRTILFVLSRAAFGQRTSPADLWRSQRQVWWSQLLHTLIQQRLSPWRSLTQPVYQLEGVRLLKAGPRVRQIRRRKVGSAMLVTFGYSFVEQCLVVALLSLAFWFAPEGETPMTLDLLTGVLPTFIAVATPIALGIVVLFLEPFYVAAGFGIYLNRRAELEAWDIEQEFRRAFA
jgi:hypothetical protein